MHTMGRLDKPNKTGGFQKNSEIVLFGIRLANRSLQSFGQLR